MHRSVVVVFFTILVFQAVASADVLRATDDAYVSGGNITACFPTTDGLQLKNTGDVGNDLLNSRKVWIRFNRSSHPQAVQQADLTLHLAAAIGQDAGSLRDWQFEVYGLVDSCDTWSQSTLTWKNAPGNNAELGGGVNVSQVYGGAAIATFKIHGTGNAGDVITIHGDIGSPLVNFINGDTNNFVSFIIVRTTRGDKTDTVTHVLASREYAPTGGAVGDWSPTLTLMPEPTSMTIMVLAGVMVLRRRFRKNSNQ